MQFKKILDGCGLNQSTVECLKDFIKMRKTIKKPLTEKALELTIKKLKKLTSSEEEMQVILDKSITKCWIGVFPLTEQDRVEFGLKQEDKKEKYQELLMTEEEYYKSQKGSTKVYE